jgi:hypothetical protein
LDEVGECGDAGGGSQARAVAGEGGGEGDVGVVVGDGDDERFVASKASATSVRPHTIATRQSSALMVLAPGLPASASYDDDGGNPFVPFVWKGRLSPALSTSRAKSGYSNVTA